MFQRPLLPNGKIYTKFGAEGVERLKFEYSFAPKAPKHYNLHTALKAPKLFKLKQNLAPKAPTDICTKFGTEGAETLNLYAPKAPKRPD